MNDRAIVVLEQYDLSINRTWKGRNAYFFETNEGTFTIKEYNKSVERIQDLNELLQSIHEKSDLSVEQLVPNKEGEFLTTDVDRTVYFVKTYPQGHECDIKQEYEFLEAVRSMARLHQAMKNPSLAEKIETKEFPFLTECKKRNKELIKVRKYLKLKSQKSNFELFLTSHFDHFLEIAKEVEKNLEREDHHKWLEIIKTEGLFCHGQFQHHNILVTKEGCHIINFEKFLLENPVKDLYLFMRKLLEKNDWDITLAKKLLDAYTEVRELTDIDREQLKLRFRYPEKFWKIVNAYYNAPKCWIPDKNKEKLEKLIALEPGQIRCLEYISNYR